MTRSHPHTRLDPEASTARFKLRQTGRLDRGFDSFCHCEFWLEFVSGTALYIISAEDDKKLRGRKGGRIRPELQSSSRQRILDSDKTRVKSDEDTGNSATAAIKLGLLGSLIGSDKRCVWRAHYTNTTLPSRVAARCWTSSLLHGAWRDWHSV
ncbi:hypothetical protein RRG08_020866 [Elysia crispata]|uniref:Uncharacterized protein n=1 Tax=Elysia crispata TaxID=231223 RepID=A0AAE1CMH1_9GAST|nr:hypothetical protein RRG08_020866 [Elysia crispata]